MRGQKFAFTLAEMMIAVAIVGIVAVITVPNLVSRYNQKVHFARLNKMFHDMEQNLEELRTENIYGDFLQSRFYTDNHTQLEEFFKDYYKVKKELTEEDIDAQGDANIAIDYGAKLKDGSYIAVRKVTGSPSYMRVYVDTNGSDPPNLDCQDRYQFNIYKNYKIDVVSTINVTDPSIRENSAKVNSANNTNQKNRLKCVGKYINNGWKLE